MSLLSKEDEFDLVTLVVALGDQTEAVCLAVRDALEALGNERALDGETGRLLELAAVVGGLAASAAAVRMRRQRLAAQSQRWVERSRVLHKVRRLEQADVSRETSDSAPDTERNG